MAQLVLSSAALEAIVDASVAHAVSTFNGPLDGVTMALLTGSVTFTQDTLWSALTEAAFTGYARSAALVWGASHRRADGFYELLGDLKTFVMTDAVAPQTISGFALVKGTGGSTVFWAGLAFDVPVALARAGQFLSVLPSVAQGAAPWGDATIIS